MEPSDVEVVWNGKAKDWGKGAYRDIPWSKHVLLCRERQKRDLESAKKDPEFPYYFDSDAADHVVWFFSQLTHFDGEWAGKPFVLSDWQEWDILRPLFGWKRKIDGTRRFREAYIEIARGNGKSMLAGGIALYLMLADGEFGAQVYAAATKEEQAKIVWGAAKRMVELSPLLRDEVKTFHKSITNSYLGSIFRPLGKDSKTQDGLSVHGGIIDEYHAHRDSNMRDVLASGTVKRKQPLLAIITTAGIDTECPCKRESDYGKRILQNVVQNDRYFTFIATVDDPEKWHDEAEWYKANPNLGISVYLEEIRSQYTKAKQVPSLETGFKVKNLNIWSESSKKWISPTDYAKGNGAIDWSTYRGRRSFGGLDLGISRDLSAFALLFQGEDKENGDPPDIFAKMKYWLPEESLQKRSETDGVPYQQWVDEGWITLTPGRTTRYDLIRKYINECAEEHEIFEAAMDQAHAHQLMVELADDGLNIVKHAQSMKAMTVPCRNFEEIIMQGRFKHGDDPVLRWMVDNCRIIQNADGEMKIAKDKSTERVDGAVACVMGLGRLLVSPEPVNFVYNLRGIYYK